MIGRRRSRQSREPRQIMFGTPSQTPLRLSSGRWPMPALVIQFRAKHHQQGSLAIGTPLPIPQMLTTPEGENSPQRVMAPRRQAPARLIAWAGRAGHSGWRARSICQWTVPSLELLGRRTSARRMRVPASRSSWLALPSLTTAPEAEAPQGLPQQQAVVGPNRGPPRRHRWPAAAALQRTAGRVLTAMAVGFRRAPPAATIRPVSRRSSPVLTMRTVDRQRRLPRSHAARRRRPQRAAPLPSRSSATEAVGLGWSASMGRWNRGHRRRLRRPRHLGLRLPRSGQHDGSRRRSGRSRSCGSPGRQPRLPAVLPMHRALPASMPSWRAWPAKKRPRPQGTSSAAWGTQHPAVPPARALALRCSVRPATALGAREAPWQSSSGELVRR
mmetsp:Transcript_106589/g.318557  ORF Transcript_106589/g.318557 Transcript_106589/m.318557 type:complete len:385 (-) Transcript_106589:299-1453(-)